MRGGIAALCCVAAVPAWAGGHGIWQCADDRGQTFTLAFAADGPRVTRGAGAPVLGHDVTVSDDAIEWIEDTAGTPRHHRFEPASGRHRMTQFLELVGRSFITRAACTPAD